MITLLRLSFLALSFLVSMLGVVRGETIYCNSCADCSGKIQAADPGDMIVLSGDIDLENGITCIDFNGKSDVIFDGGGHSITNTGDVNYGIFSGYSGGNGNTIQNCSIHRFTGGMYQVYGSGNTIRNSRFNLNNTAIELYSSNSNTIENVVIDKNSIGISIRNDSDGNTITRSYIYANYTKGLSFSPHPSVGDPEYNLVYDNYFSNSGTGNIDIVRLSTDSDRVLGNICTFETAFDCTSRNNIVGGSCVGGNFWTSPSGGGFSETCTDIDQDGICDIQFDLSINNATLTDSFPLANSITTNCANPDKDSDGFETVSCGGLDCDDRPWSCGDNCYPGAIEVCDGNDNDCDGIIDEEIDCSDSLLVRSAHYPSIISGHSCVEDPFTNKIYCFGGDYRASTNESGTDMIVKYDPYIDVASPLVTKLPTIRSGLSCVADSNSHKIYCFGGYWQEFTCTQWEPWGCVGGYITSHYLNEIVEFDPVSESLTVKHAVLSAGMSGLSCVEDPTTNMIYCFGGKEYGSNRSNQVQEYDPTTDMLTVKSAILPSGRADLSCAWDSLTGKFYCFGGRTESETVNEIIVYDPITDSIDTSEGSLPVPIHQLSCATDSAQNKIYCFGGYTPGPEPYYSYYLHKILEYDPFMDSLTIKESTFPFGRYGLSCAENSGTHKIYCSGGSRNVVSFDDFAEYTPKSWWHGDFDHDCDVDEFDLAGFSPDFGGTECGKTGPCEGDFDGDGDVDGVDFNKLTQKYGITTCP